MGVADHELDAAQTALFERANALAPELFGGKVDRGSENKVPIVAAVSLDYVQATPGT